MNDPHTANDGSRIDTWIRPFFEDSSLWPVLIVAVAIFVTMGTTLLLLATQERNPFAVAAGLLLLWMSVDVVVRDRRNGRFGLASRCVAGFWAACIGAAVVVVWLGLF